jgi:NSS family neurotransmitter:Na+ symporter
VVSAGVGLAFVTIPKAVNSLPWPVFFGTLFFLALMFAGVSSLISICEVSVAALTDRFNFERKKAVSVFCLIGFIFSIIFTTRGGLLVLDIVDHFINNFGVLAGGLVEIVFISWFCRLVDFQEHINKTSDFSVGSWWIYCLKIITPLALGIVSIMNLVEDITVPYGNYPQDALAYLGWIPVIAILVIGVVIQKFGLGKSNSAQSM